MQKSVRFTTQVHLPWGQQQAGMGAEVPALVL